MLDKRLKMIYDLIPDGTVCDVGTDHCKLAAYCVTSGKSERALATDLREGPLSAARRLIEKEGLSDKITTLISDGFDDIPDALFENTDTFVIAGMGGELIENILSRRLCKKTLVLQPMSAIHELCAYLMTNGYTIQKRVFCEDGDKLYTAMRVVFDGVKKEPDLLAGSVRDEVFYRYIDKELMRISRAREGILSSQKSDKTRLDGLEALEIILNNARNDK